MNTKLPDAKYFEYMSHLYHCNRLIPMSEWTQSWSNYPSHELKKFETVILNNQSMITNNRILDLGCHSGYMCYIASQLGATSVTGVNIRQQPIEVANYFFNQLQVPNYNFIVGNIEDFDLLEQLCNTADTVILSTVLEHLRNPEFVLRTISNSNVQNIIIESSIADDNADGPMLYYYTHDSNLEFNAFDNNKKSLGCCPNQRFLEVILYYHGWQITKYEKHDSFSADWFGTRNLDTFPMLRKVVSISATKFK
jgi:SAM-dependent methyltransferase